MRKFKEDESAEKN